MSKSRSLPAFGRGSSGRSFGRSGRGGTVTLIEDRVTRSYTRTAKIAFYVVSAVVGLLAATVAASYWHPILALAAGLLIGVVVALPIAGFIAAWPVIRVLWWWAPEIITAALVVSGFALLSMHTGLVVRVLVVALVAGIPAGVPAVRRRVVALVWCLISRHRLRACFNEFIISNRSGSLPLILWATPTPVGERVWIWLRPGLSLADLESRLDKIAVACWAANITVERASSRNAAFVRADIKRRDALTGTVNSPLVDLVDPDTPTVDRTSAEAPAALDLPDIPAPAPEAAPAPRATKRADRSERADKKPTPAPTPASAKSDSADDVLDWV
ncbi:hypothetical protein [Actinomadura madurae]|uniref:hypothetical protein n=1 Tax=Actinomadura madurae TaxID=1993 RepID=UPI0020D1FD58|nr:hypothetical protein [Actinomadura madurae]MCP9949282.1 hypothetical protein [Actinomadura madurae]MCP9966036.1 hypothetical protein [Actinomadura madurae]MCP9978521.1 hypothetical protein [Actinomadura madurae]MCQ0009949.1 hypothetical protein [Actinomadura madurae]MCQ0014726.1 hypothetical protein [Actinomadura madurae]